ncbi:MAG: hypothetical protein AAF843_19710 [Bacteroidota bacterium]
MPEEIFSTKNRSIAQNRHTDSFVLTYEYGVIEFKLCDLYAFRKKIMGIDMVRLLDAESADIEIIRLPHCDRFLVLDVYGILQFRELLNGTFDILALNSTIQKILRQNAFNF